ncbi:MAG: hypothetical protein ACK4RZ_07075 [Paracoccaceae bacterium]
MKRTKRALLAAVLPFGLTLALQAQDIPPRTAAQEKVMTELFSLPHDRLMKTLTALGVTPSDDYLSCVCRAAGYGSSSTQQYYHPGTIGDYDKRYSCQHPGDPCIVSGFGCSRHPLPSDPKIWENCAATQRGKDGAAITDAVLAGLAARETASVDTRDFAKLYAECRARYGALEKTDAARIPYDGAAYLQAQGIKILPPPPKIAARHKADAQTAQASVREQMQQMREDLKANVEANLAAQIFGQVAKNPNTYAEAADTVLDYVKLMQSERKARLESLSGEIATARKRFALDGAGENGANSKALNALEMSHRKSEAELTTFAREQKALERFALGVDTVDSLLTAEGIYIAATAGDNRDKAKALMDGAGLVEKYMGMIGDAADQGAQELAELARKGTGQAEYSQLLKLRGRAESMADAVSVLSKGIETGTYALEVYDTYKQFEAVMDKAQSYADSGAYGDAQQNMLNAFNTLSVLTEKASSIMPPGVADMAQFYAEAMKTPAMADEFMRKVVDRVDEQAQISGGQAGTQAMRDWVDEGGADLMRDPYLFREAGLSVYEVDQGRPAKYAFLPNANGKLIFASQEDYDRIAAMAYYFPIVEGRRMTDADVRQRLDETGAIGVAALKAEAERKLAEAAANKRVADLVGKPAAATEDWRDWHKFNTLLTKVLPFHCALDRKQEKALFNAWREPAGRERVEQQLTELGSNLKAADKK